MRTVTTRQLLHENRKIREALQQGETLRWTQRGQTIAVMKAPDTAQKVVERIDWNARSKSMDLVLKEGVSISNLVLDER